MSNYEDERVTYRLMVDAREDKYLDELEDSKDWRYLEELMCHASDELREKFWTGCLEHLMSQNAVHAAFPLSTMVRPLKAAVAEGINERVQREIKAELNQAQEEAANKGNFDE